MINNLAPNFPTNPATFFTPIMAGAPIPMRSDTTLYVGNLGPQINDVILFGMGSQYGKVISSRVMKDRYTRQSREFGFITYSDPVSAVRAQKDLNFKIEFQRELRVYLKRDVNEFDKNANLIIRNLPKNITSKKLNELSQEFGDVYSCFAKSIEKDNRIEYCGFGYVQFQKLEAAEKFKKHFENNLLGGQKLLIEKHIPSVLREKKPPRNLYVKDFPKEWSKEKIEEFLSAEFGAFGEIESKSVNFHSPKNAYYSFVGFKNAEDAARAKQEMNNKSIEGSTLYVVVSETMTQRKKNNALNIASNI